MDECMKFTRYHDYQPLKWSMLWQIFLSCVTIMMTAIYLKTQSGNVLFHPNFKVLLRVYFVCIIIRCSLAIFFLSKNTIFLTFFHPCDMWLTGLDCYVFRHTTNSLLALMSVLQLAMTFERLIACLSASTYEKRRNHIGIVFAVLSIIVAETLTLSLQWVFPLVDYVPFCGRARNFIKVAGINGNIVFSVICTLIDMVSLLLLLVIQFITSRKNNSTRISIRLSEKFEQLRNKTVLAGLLPTLLFHGIFSILVHVTLIITLNFQNDLSDVEVDAMSTFLYFTNVYTSLAPIVLYYSQKRLSPHTEVTLKADGDSYFKKYSDMWK